MWVELVRTTTPDGMRLDGALHPALASAGPIDLAICLHGVQSNFYGSTLLEALVPVLIECGISVLRVNTRGHDGVTAATVADRRRWQGAAFEIVDECRLDVQGWLTWAADRGYQRVLMLGHSLGAIKCLYAAAHESLPLVQGVAAISPPRLSYSHFREGFDNDKFFESLAIAEGLIQQRKPEALFQAKFPFPLFITANGYLEKYGPRERYNFVHFLTDVRVPALLVFGSKELHDSAAFTGIRDAIAELEIDAQRLQVVTIDDANHIYSGQYAALGGALVGWLQSLAHSG